jgi:twinkle protein
VTGLVPAGTPEALPRRSLTLDTCQKWGVGVTDLNGQRVHAFNYRDATGRIVAQKLRFPGKEFRFVGDTKNAGLFGQHLWRDKAPRVVITEGELDAMSVSQVQANKWPVVSVPNGAQGAKKALERNLEWLDGFDEVVLMFDQDEPGKAAAAECADVFTPGKCKVATLPLKDPNEMLQAGRGKEIIDAIFGAKVMRPDGIVNAADMWDEVIREDDSFLTSFPWQVIQEKTDGIGLGDVVMFCAGSGAGKTEITRELEYHLLQLGETVGTIRLEEPKRRTLLGLLGLALNRRLHRKGVLTEVPEEELRAAFDRTLGTGRLFLYDHFGSTNIDNLLGKVRYLAKGCGCRFIVLDHLSIVVSGEEDGDERRLIDNLMTGLKTLAMECNVGLIVISHLKRPAGDKGHEDGVRTSLAQLRGSHSIGQLSDTVIGAERDQQHPTHANVVTLRILKCRRTGETGEAGWLTFNGETGRLTENLDNPFDTEDDTASGGDSPF